jgi:hypothetical protein
MKKFKITYTATREFEVPDNCTDEQYDELKAICLLGLTKEPVKPDEIKVELVTRPDEPKPKYETNKDCD